VLFFLTRLIGFLREITRAPADGNRHVLCGRRAAGRGVKPRPQTDLLVEVPDFNVDHVQSGMRGGVVAARIPLTGIEIDVGKFFESHAAPVPAGVQAPITPAGNLKEQGLGAASLGAKRVGAQHAAVAVVSGDDREFLRDCCVNGSIIIGEHVLE
jgi:hypothetical protein